MQGETLLNFRLARAGGHASQDLTR